MWKRSNSTGTSFYRDLSLITDMNSYIVFIDGKKSENPEFDLSNLDERSVSVFETMRVFGTSAFRLDKHLDRLFASAKTVGLRIPKDRKTFEREIKTVLRQLKTPAQFFLRLTLFENQTVIFIFDRSYPDHLYEKGIDLRTTTVRRNPSNSVPPEAKTGQFLNGILSFFDSVSQESFEALFLDSAGYVKEARVWNFFLVKNEILKTPARDGILNGVTRQFVIECAGKERMDVSETNLTRHEVWNADEAFITNTSGGIVPVRSVDGRKIGEKIPGEITRRLTKRFQIELNEEIKSQ